MPITIQEIIASDTISQLVDKTNFNFDQLLLNGGGPAGPAGIAGPTGPAGGRGFKGTTWYEDTATTAPGNTPIAVPPTAAPLVSDYYLQFNGQVWEYNGTAWVVTTVDLEGPTGPAGQSGGFGDTFGSPAIGNQNTRYNGPIGLNNGANADNQGIPSVMIGGAVSTTVPLTGIPLTAAYIIPDAIATAITSSVASLVIHQKDAGGRSIVFQGGNAPGNLDKFEQTNLAQLSTIKIGVNDRLISKVTKRVIPAEATAMNDLIGYVVESNFRSQSYTAGQQIRMVTGMDSVTYGVTQENSNFEIQVGTGANTGGNLFQVSTLGTAGSSLLEIGNIPALVTSTALAGKFQLQSGDTRFVTSPTNPFGVYAGSSITLNTISNVGDATGSINLQAGVGNISATATTGTIALTTDGRIEIRTGSASTLYPRIDLDKDTIVDDTIVIASNANTSITLAEDNITTQTATTGSTISINAAGTGNTVNIAASPSSGKIVLGDSVGVSTTLPKIEMLFSGVTPVTNIRGHVQYMLDGTPANDDIDIDNQAIYIETKTSLAGDVVVRMGGDGVDRTNGVASLAVMAGNNNASMYLGKSAIVGGTVFGETDLGLYINSTPAWGQGTAISPAAEKFRATENSTKINNVLIWGGKNGGQLVLADPLTKEFTDKLASAAPITDIAVTTPYLRIQHLSNQYFGDDEQRTDYYVNTNIYSASNTGGLITATADTRSYTKIYQITPQDEWYTGQRMHVEVLNFPASFEYLDGQDVEDMTQNGLIQLKIPNGRTTSSAGVDTWEYLTFNCGGPQTNYTNPVTPTPSYPYGDMTGKVGGGFTRRGVVNNTNVQTLAPIDETGNVNPNGTRWSATFQFDGRAIEVMSQSGAVTSEPTEEDEGTYLTYTYIPGWRMVGEPQSEFIQLPTPEARPI